MKQELWISADGWKEYCLVVDFEYYEGEPESYNCPASGSEIDINSIELHGFDVYGICQEMGLMDKIYKAIDDLAESGYFSEYKEREDY